GRGKGSIPEAPLQSLPGQRWDEDSVGEHLQPLDQLPSIGDGTPLWQAILQLDQPEVNRLLVLGPAGLPTGTLERPELAERVLKELGVRLPLPILEAARRQGVYPLGMMLAPVARTIESNPEG
ncbi:MAG: site-2 protease family protein, partial [Vulcanococcus sp.]